MWCREEAANVHISIADFCFQQLQRKGKDVVMKKDLELEPEDVRDKDILISLGTAIALTYSLYTGGDGTYLRTAGIIETKDTPILGLNTDPSRSIGFLCNNKIYNDMKEKQIEKIFENLEKENFEYFYR
jgi:NAD+ kinase